MNPERHEMIGRPFVTEYQTLRMNKVMNYRYRTNNFVSYTINRRKRNRNGLTDGIATPFGWFYDHYKYSNFELIGNYVVILVTVAMIGLIISGLVLAANHNGTADLTTKTKPDLTKNLPVMFHYELGTVIGICLIIGIGLTKFAIYYYRIHHSDYELEGKKDVQIRPDLTSPAKFLGKGQQKKIRGYERRNYGKKS